MTQVELANALGLQQYNITNYERGTRLPSADKILEIAKALGVTVANIYGQDKAEEDEQAPRTAHNARTKQIQKLFEDLKPNDQRTVLKLAQSLVH